MKPTDNRKRIVESALALIAERGYASTSVADIAQGADLSKGNLSYYFRTKAEMLEALTAARTEELFQQLNRRLMPEMTALERVHAFLQEFEENASDLARHGCPVGSLCSELGRVEPNLRPFASRILNALSGWLEEQFAEIASAKEAPGLAEHLLVLCQGAAVLAHANGDPKIVVRQAAHARAWLNQRVPKLVEQTGIKPATSSLRTTRSIN